MYPVGKHIRASALVTLTVCGFACLSADTALAQTWRLTGPPAFPATCCNYPDNTDSIFQPGTSRTSGGVTTTLNSLTASSAAFTTTDERWGTSSISYSWSSPPEVLHTGDVVAFNIRWNIGQKYKRFSPQMGTLVHLDRSTNWYTTQCYGETCNTPTTSGQERNTVITVTSDNATQLFFSVDVHSVPGSVRVQWTYRRVDADVPPSPSTPGAPGAATTAPSYPNVVITPEGKLQPAPGYRWVSDAADDQRVIWNPGSRHPQYPNVVAGTAEGGWEPAAGYRWITNAPGDMQVVPKDGAGQTDAGSSATPTRCAQETMIYTNSIAEGVQNGPTQPTRFQIDVPTVVTYLMSYHWNDGRGQPAGTVYLRHQDGTSYGGQAGSASGQGGVPSAVWIVRPNAVLKPGVYTVIDSHPSTWAQNAQSNGQGIVEVKGCSGR